MTKFTKSDLQALENNQAAGEYVEFKDPHIFRAVDTAMAHAKDLGFSVGRMQARSPMALFKGDCDISKWRNLGRAEQANIDGAIVGDMRNGPVFFCLPKQ